jgi:hypothetical protein
MSPLYQISRGDRNEWSNLPSIRLVGRTSAGDDIVKCSSDDAEALEASGTFILPFQFNRVDRRSVKELISERVHRDTQIAELVEMQQQAIVDYDYGLANEIECKINSLCGY